MKWLEEERKEISILKDKFYESSCQEQLSQSDLLRIKTLDEQLGKEYSERTTKVRKEAHLNNTKQIRKRARQIIGKELTLYFFPIWGVDDFKKYQYIKKKFKIYGFDENVYAFVCHNEKPLTFKLLLHHFCLLLRRGGLLKLLRDKTCNLVYNVIIHFKGRV